MSKSEGVRLHMLGHYMLPAAVPLRSTHSSCCLLVHPWCMFRWTLLLVNGSKSKTAVCPMQQQHCWHIRPGISRTCAVSHSESTVPVLVCHSCQNPSVICHRATKQQQQPPTLAFGDLEMIVRWSALVGRSARRVQGAERRICPHHPHCRNELGAPIWPLHPLLAHPAG